MAKKKKPGKALVAGYIPVEHIKEFKLLIDAYKANEYAVNENLIKLYDLRLAAVQENS